MSTELSINESTLERLPPQSLEAEQAVLGALLISGDGMSRVVDILEPDYFYRKAHQVIYAATLDLFDKNEPIDIITVSQFLKDSGQLDQVGGRQYITDLALSVATTANLEYYAKVVQEKALLRHLIKAGTEIVTSCYEETDAEIAIDRAEHLIFSLAQRRSMAQLVHIKHIVESSFQKIEQRYENRDQLSGCPTGFYDLDALTAGFQPSDLVIIAARPSMGKCLAFDSEIVLGDGSIKTIQELYNARSANLLTLDSAFNLRWTAPSAFVDDGLKPVFKVTTRLGRTVETTLSHPFLTINGWKKLQEIRVGSRIAVPRRMPVFGTKMMPECEIKLLAYLTGDACRTNDMRRATGDMRRVAHGTHCVASDMHRVSDDVHRVSNDMYRVSDNTHRATSDVHRVTNDMHCSDDRVSDDAHRVPNDMGAINAMPSLNNTDPTLQKDFKQAVAECGSSDAVLKQQTKWWGKSSGSKAVPDVVFTLTREQLALFINRLFSTDGWATVLASGGCQVGFASVSKKLCTQLQHLLLRFGIIARVCERRGKARGDINHTFQLAITDKTSISRFIKNIGIFGKEAAVSRVKVALERNLQSNGDLIPIEVGCELQQANGNESWSSYGHRSFIPAYSNLNVNKLASTAPRVLRLAPGTADMRFRDVSQNDIYWDEIVSIEPMGTKQVYDLTVPETHNFIANDICVHNTAFVLNIAQHAAVEAKMPVAIFSLEMSKEQLVQRMLCSEANIDANRLRTGHMHSNDWTSLAMAMGRLGEAPIFIDDSAGVSALDIRAKCRRLKAEMKGLGLVIIDYIQLMSGRKATDNRVQEVSEISRSLKTLAREIGVPVIALSQLSRAVEARQNKRPMLSDLRESGSIEQDADIVMFIYRDEYYNQESDKRGEAEIIIAKQRNGPVGTVDLLYQSSITRFLNKVHNQYTTA